MNSDEHQTQEQQEPAVETFDVSEETSPSVIAPVQVEELDTSLVAIVEDSEEVSAHIVAAIEKTEEPGLAVGLETPADDGVGLTPDPVASQEQRVAELQRQEQQLREEIATLQATHSKMLADQLAETRTAMNRLVQESLSELEQRKQTLQIAVEQLERRRERIREEMRKSFAGVSQDLAIRVQGFKDYLVGSLQDLAVAAEELQLQKAPEPEKPAPEEKKSAASTTPQNPKFAEQAFQSTTKQIRSILDQYRTRPDYYGPPWQLRRTFEPVHAERVSNWFFTQGGRGAIRTMGSRLQNILITSAIISVLSTLYGDRQRTLVLANSPERLGEWRRGLQDCLGISRSDFGPERGIVLFESAEAVMQKADRLLTEEQLPLIVIDETEDQINLSLLQFPMWLAFAPDPQQMSADMRY